MASLYSIETASASVLKYLRRCLSGALKGEVNELAQLLSAFY